MAKAALEKKRAALERALAEEVTEAEKAAKRAEAAANKMARIRKELLQLEVPRHVLSVRAMEPALKVSLLSDFKCQRH